MPAARGRDRDLGSADDSAEEAEISKKVDLNPL